jgi:hypothetical protein
MSVNAGVGGEWAWHDMGSGPGGLIGCRLGTVGLSSCSGSGHVITMDSWADIIGWIGAMSL